MIESIHFKNFKALRNSKLELGHFTLLVGPNGSGKTTAMQALVAARESNAFPHDRIVTAGMPGTQRTFIRIHWGGRDRDMLSETSWRSGGSEMKVRRGAHPWNNGRGFLWERLGRLRIYSLQAQSILAAVALQPNMQLGQDGSGLAGVLDRLRDQHPERFDTLNKELGRWIPEFDQVLFDTPGAGTRVIVLRVRRGGHKIAAADLSQGTLFALAILTLAHLPDPAPIICLEEPDHGMHPRLLRDVRDAIYRLAYPENFGEKRDPVQVIATTHSPYMLDLFRDHPEEIVIAQKTEDNVVFERLSDRADLDEILHDTHLGDAWYSGILGGVPAER